MDDRRPARRLELRPGPRDRHAHALAKPLVILEALEVDYPWASDRLHRFVIDGMRDNAAAFRDTPITYYPYVEPAPGDGRGLLDAFARDACVVITDDFPCFFLPRLVAAAASRLDVRLEAVDSNGLIPLAAADHAFTTAASYRRWMQKTLAGHLDHLPRARPLDDARLERLVSLPRAMQERWAPASDRLLHGDAAELAQLPIDHEVPVVEVRGGANTATEALRRFTNTKLPRYADLHNAAESDATSRLSPYLHFGHLSAHQIFDSVMGHERWSKRLIAEKPSSGAREGWWGVSASAEAFLDQLVVWRELGYNMCATRPLDYDQYASLPGWARTRWTRTCRTGARTFTTWRRSNAERHTTRSGTRRKARCGARAGSITTCGCCGGRRSSSGRQRHSWHWNE